MAKVIAPFTIKGTLDDLNFYNASNENLVRLKGKTGITKEQFANNPIYNRIRQHSSEFSRCSLKSRTFRLLAKKFYDNAKEVSFAGRVNKLLFEILEEDLFNTIGERKIENGLQNLHSEELLLEFEGNKLRPLHLVWDKKVTFNWERNTINKKNIEVSKNILWPEPEANLIHLQLAIANWNCAEDRFENHYSNEITIGKSSAKTPLNFKLNTLQSKELWIAFLFIGFSNKERRNCKPLHKKWNTATIIGVKNFLSTHNLEGVKP